MSDRDYKSLDSESSSWEHLGFDNQLFYHQDKRVFNLSSIDFDFNNLYEFEESNKSDTEYNVITTGRGVTLSLFVLIFLVGIIGNILVIYTVASYVTMRRVTYLYLLNLAVADILYLLTCLPALSVSYALVDWRFGKVFCKLENYLMSVSMSVSVMTIMATGLDRYIAVLHPLRSRNFRTSKKTVSVICLTWILSLAIMSPRIQIFDEITAWHVIGWTTLCSRVQTDTILLLDTCLNFVFMYLLPLISLSACHSRIGRRLWKSRRPGSRLPHRGQMGMLLVHDRRRIAKMVFAITIIFALGWLPVHIYHLVEDFDKGNILLGEVIDRGTIVLFFSFGANSLNPIFYCLYSGSFRKHFKQVLQCRTNRFATSVNDEELRQLRTPNAQAEIADYPRRCQILHPRPASLLADSLSSVDNTSVYFQQATTSINQVIFPVTTQPAENIRYHLNNIISSNLHTNNPHFSLNDTNIIEKGSSCCSNHTNNKIEQNESGSMSLIYYEKNCPENTYRKPQSQEIKRSLSFSGSKFPKRITNSSTNVGLKLMSTSFPSYEKEDLLDIKSFKEKRKIQASASNQNELLNIFQETDTNGQKQGSKGNNSLTSPTSKELPRNFTNHVFISDDTNTAAMRTSSQTLESQNAMKTPHEIGKEQELAVQTVFDARDLRNGSLGTSLPNVTTCNQVCSRESLTPVSVNRDCEILSSHKLFCLNIDNNEAFSSQDFSIQTTESTKINHHVSNQKETTTQRHNYHYNLPPVD